MIHSVCFLRRLLSACRIQWTATNMILSDRHLQEPTERWPCELLRILQSLGGGDWQHSVLSCQHWSTVRNDSEHQNSNIPEGTLGSFSSLHKVSTTICLFLSTHIYMIRSKRIRVSGHLPWIQRKLIGPYMCSCKKTLRVRVCWNSSWYRNSSDYLSRNWEYSPYNISWMLRYSMIPV